MKCLLFFLFIPLSTTYIFAQKNTLSKPKKNLVTLSFNNGLTFNKFNVYNNGISPDPIEVPHATTYKPSVLLTYQRRTSYGLIYGGGFQVGNYKHEVDVAYHSFAHLDTMQEFKDGSYKFEYRSQSLYLGLHFFIGYSFLLNPKKENPLYLETKVGITKKIYFSGGNTEDYLNAGVLSNDTIFAGYLASYIDDHWGNYKNISPNFLEGYIGFRKQVGWKYINDFSLGAFATSQFQFLGAASKSGLSETKVRSGIYLHGVFQRNDIDYYYNKEVTFGIRAGFGLNF